MFSVLQPAWWVCLTRDDTESEPERSCPMFTPFIERRAETQPAVWRAFAVVALAAAVEVGMTACAPEPPPSAMAGVIAPVAAASAAARPPHAPVVTGDPSVPAASDVFGGKTHEASAQPDTF